MPNKLILHGFFVFFFAIYLASCAALIKRVPEGLVLNGLLRTAFARIVGHKTSAITLGMRLTLYGTDVVPNGALECHERVHREQAARISQLHVAAELIDDTPSQRSAAWLGVYAHQYLFFGYDNRFELEARAACDP